jgi:hypothetical protein
MTFITTTFLATFLLAIQGPPPSPQDCSLATGTPSPKRVFTNADLERMAACRYQTGVLSAVSGAVPESPGPTRSARGSKPESPTSASAQRDEAEAEWRAQWRSVDQKVRKLRLEARELRQEAGESPRDPKKRVVGRRSPSLLIARAQSLETQAREIEDEFEERARREGALPGWIRPKGR